MFRRRRSTAAREQAARGAFRRTSRKQKLFFERRTQQRALVGDCRISLSTRRQIKAQESQLSVTNDCFLTSSEKGASLPILLRELIMAQQRARKASSVGELTSAALVNLPRAERARGRKKRKARDCSENDVLSVSTCVNAAVSTFAYAKPLDCDEHVCEDKGSKSRFDVRLSTTGTKGNVNTRLVL